MQAVPELVSERQDRSAVARVVHQHVRVHARNRRGAKRPGSLVRANGPVDPVVVEEARDDHARLVRELAVRIDDDPTRLVPRDLPRVRRDRCRPVVVLEPVDSEQPGLEPVVALRDVVPRRRRLDERVDRLVRRLVREVARRDPGRIAAHAVVDRLVQQNGVEDERARPEAGPERLGDRLGGDAPGVAIGVEEAGERRLERHVVAVETDAERAQLLLVEPRPRRDTGDGLLGDDALFGLGEQERPELSQRAEMVAPVVERRVVRGGARRRRPAPRPTRARRREAASRAPPPSRPGVRRARRVRSRPCWSRRRGARRSAAGRPRPRSARARQPPRRGSQDRSRRPCRGSAHGRRRHRPRPARRPRRCAGRRSPRRDPTGPTRPLPPR